MSESSPSSFEATAPAATTSSAPVVNAAPAGRKLRLRRLLTLPFVALVLIPAMIIAGTSLRAGLTAIDALSLQLIEDISSRVEQAAVHQLEEASITLRAAHPDPANSADGASPTFASFETLEKRLFELTSQARTTSYIFFGGADGTFLGVDRERLGSQASATVRLQERAGQPRKIYSARAPLDRTRLVETEARVFNVTERPWFKGAKDAREVSWTPIYVSFASGALVTTASQPVVAKGGKFLGVIAADVELTELSSFMKTVTVSPNGVAYIVDSGGLLVASSSLDAPYLMEGTTQRRVSAEQSKTELMKVSAAWLNSVAKQRKLAPAVTPGIQDVGAKTGEPISAVLSSSLGAVDVSARTVSRIKGSDWQVVVAVPRSDFTGAIVSSAVVTFLVTLAALICSLLLGLWVLRRVTDDVETLVKSTNRVSGDQIPLDIAQPKLFETSQLADAFRAMVGRVHESMSTIRSQNEQLGELNAGLETRVTERTDELRQRNQNLSDEIALRTRYERELYELSRTAVSNADNKARFLAMLSHELRTPLQAIIGSGQMLSTKLTHQPAELATLDAGAKSLLALVDGILSFSRLEAGRVQLTLTRFEVAKCADEARLVAIASRPGYVPAIAIQIAPEVPRVIVADAGMIRQTLINLLYNALKHAPDKPISIYIDPHSKQPAAASTNMSSRAAWLRISVIDQGPGISQDDQKRLFTPFEQLGNSDKSDPNRGSGLGLAICALLVKEMGGEISVRSTEGQGAAFTFSVPVETVDANDPDAASPISTEIFGARTRLSKALTTQRVLLVEDHDTNRMLVTQLLERLNQSVVAVASGEAALAEISHAPFDVVVLDLNLPGMSGIDVVRSILAPTFAEKTPYPFVLPTLAALTASDDPVDRANALAAGFHLFLTKPTTLSKLESMLLSVGESARTGRAVRQSATPNAPAASTGDRRTQVLLLDQETLEPLLAADRTAPTPFLARLLQQFITHLGSEIDAIEAAVNAKNHAKVRALCHATKGAALSVGTPRLVACLAVLEAAPEPAAVAALKQVAEETRFALAQWSQLHLTPAS